MAKYCAFPAAVVILSALLSPAFASGQMDSDHSVRDLPPELSQVRSGGAWEHGDRRGYFRIVTVRAGWEHVRDEVFVQWLWEDPDRKRVEVIAHRAIAEINEPRIWAIGPLNFVLSPDRPTEVTIPGTNAYTLDQRVWHVRLGPPGTYSIIEPEGCGGLSRSIP